MATPLNNSLIKGFEILGLFSVDRHEISASTLVRELNMNIATAHRFLSTLEDVGALNALRRGTYTLGHQMTEIGQLSLRANALGAIVQPVLDTLSHDLNESVTAGRLLGNKIVCIAATTSRGDVAISTRVGRQFEAYASAHGKVWLAAMTAAERESYLEKIHIDVGDPSSLPDVATLQAELALVVDHGFAVNRGEREPELAGVSVPAFDQNGNLIVSLAVYGLLSRFDDALIDTSVRRLKQAASDINSALKAEDGSR